MTVPGLPDGYDRGSDEFSRVLAFSDGMFAIAMTLLIVAVTVPNLHDPSSTHELAHGLHALSNSLESFFISFAVIGMMWIQHHRFVARLARMDDRLITLNLVYLAFIAFLPFPTNLIGDYFSNPLAVAIYAGTLAVISALEALLLAHSHRAGLLGHGLSESGFRHRLTRSLLPVAFMLTSIPMAWVWTPLAAAMWFGGIPSARVLEGRYSESSGAGDSSASQ